MKAFYFHSANHIFSKIRKADEKIMKKNFRWIAGFLSLSLAMGIFCVFLGNMSSSRKNFESVTVSAEKEKIQVIIDPGHGGLLNTID